MKAIQKLVLSNFKRFGHLELTLDDKLNVFIGDNEAGKSSILLALDLVLSGSRSKVEAIGLEMLFNTDAIRAFLSGSKNLDTLPKLFIEAYLNEQKKPGLCGKNNSKGLNCDGLRLSCEPIDTYSREIQEALKGASPTFPFEYYAVTFQTFAAEPYASQQRPLRHVSIDSSQINSDYATREYTRSVYGEHASDLQQSRHEHLYRTAKRDFSAKVLADMNSGLADYQFAVRTGPKSTLEADLRITEGDIPIESKGKGRQCLIKTDFALRKGSNPDGISVLLLEEPENHLSHANMKKMIRGIAATEKQLFIATHSSLICARLDLRKAILLSSGGGGVAATLSDLSEDTAEFFMKAPDHHILEFALSRKAILVEGDAEFILLDALYKKTCGSTLEADGVHVISVGGTSFKRYLELARILEIKTAVLRDNDRDYQKNCVDRYADFSFPHVRVFADTDPARHTFEVCLYRENASVCEGLFSTSRAKLSVEEFMLKNKADAAFSLLSDAADRLIAPSYISDAVRWIRE